MNATKEQRFDLPADQYLERNHVLVYLEDAITQLLEHKDDNATKVNPFKFFSSYFASVKEGTHILLREYSFIRATLHNRASFVRLFWRSFSNIARKSELMSVYDYHSLLCILCPDFPFSVVQKTARIVLVDDSLDCLMSFTDFVYAFQLQLCFEEFLNKSAEVYQSLLQNRAIALETVVVPTSEQRLHSTHSTASIAHGDAVTASAGSLGGGGHSQSSSIEGVEASLLQRTLVLICDKMDMLIPSDVLREIQLPAGRITFYGFMTALAKSPAINQHVGKLPMKSELMTTFEPEMTSTTPILPPHLLTDNADVLSNVSSTTTSTAASSRPSSEARPSSSPANSSVKSVSRPSTAVHVVSSQSHQQQSNRLRSGSPNRRPTSSSSGRPNRNTKQKVVETTATTDNDDTDVDTDLNDSNDDDDDDTV